MLVVEKLLGAAVMFILCALIPFVWWKIKYKKKETFFIWLGFRKPKLKKSVLYLIIFGVLYCATYFLNLVLMSNMSDSSNAAGDIYKGLGALAILPAIVETFLMNGLCEELFFRGFLTKRLIEKLGVNKGVLLQGILFGMMHNVLFLLAGAPISTITHLVIFISTAVGAIQLAFLNEKVFNGSILPSVFLHGLENFTLYMILAFM